MAEREYTREEMLKYVPEEHVNLHFAKGRFKSCPFCGAEAWTYVAIGGFAVGCNNKGCFRYTFVNTDLEELIKKWNRRDG